MATKANSFYASRGDYALSGLNSRLAAMPLAVDQFVDFRGSRRNDGTLLAVFYESERPLFLQAAAPDDGAWFLKNGLADHVDLVFSAPVDKSTLAVGTFTWRWATGSEQVDPADIEFSEDDRQLRILAPTLPVDYVGSLSLNFSDFDSANALPLTEVVSLNYDITETNTFKSQPGGTSYSRGVTVGYLVVDRMVVPFGQNIDLMIRNFIGSKGLSKDRILKVLQVEGPNGSLDLFLLWFKSTAPKVLSVTPRASGTLTSESPPTRILLQFDQAVQDPTDFGSFDDVALTDAGFTVSMVDTAGKQWAITKSGGLFATDGQHTLKISGLPDEFGELSSPPMIFSWQVQPLSGAGGTSDHGSLTGLGDDDHTQYHNDARGDARYAPIAKGVTNGDSHDHSGGDGAQIDHGGLAGLANDDHTQYLLRTEAAWKTPVRVVATTNITRSATQTIDGVSLSIGDRVLLTAESSAQYNGVWLVAAGSWTRATDLDVSAEFFRGIVILVNEGTAGAGTIWRYDTPTSGFTLNTTSQTWTQISTGASGITAALISRTVYTTGTGATHSPNASAQKVRIICVGGGGGGGGAAQAGAQCGVGGGGGSGGITDYWWTPNGNITYTVGAAGLAGTAGNNPGGAGGDTTATGTGLSLTAKGGNGGGSMAAGTGHTAALGGAVNTGTTGGDINIDTGEGMDGVRQGGVLGIAGNGADCGPYGRGGPAGAVNTAGKSARGFGAGGGGAHANGAGGVNLAGGTGGGGLIIIEEYY